MGQINHTNHQFRMMIRMYFVTLMNEVFISDAYNIFNLVGYVYQHRIDILKFF